MTTSLPAQGGLDEAQPPSAAATAGRPSRRYLPLLALLFVGSGCAALIYEIVWLQLLGLVIGASAISLGVLLGTFMGGMCMGSWLLPRLISPRRHPLRVYACLELAIGVIGLLEPWLVNHVSDLYTHLAATGAASILLRAALSGVCLLPPTMLMGATLPAIARWVEATPKGVSWLGFFYAGNIVGAVFGCLLAGFYLLPQYDMRTASLVAAAVNATVAALGFALSTFTRHEGQAAGFRPQAVASGLQPPVSSLQPAVFVVIALSGLTALGAEVVWTRLLSVMLGATVYTFSIILAVFLLGLGIGSNAGAFVARVSRQPRLALALCQFLLAAALAWAAYAMTSLLPFWPLDQARMTDPWYLFPLDLGRCCWVVLPGALLWGASFPLALGALAGRDQDTGKLVGGVYAANTIGAIIGAMAFSMALIPWIGTQGAQRVLVVTCALSSFIALMPWMRGALLSKAGASSRTPDAARLTSALSARARLAWAGGLAVAMALTAWLAAGIAPPNWGAIGWGRFCQGWMHALYPAVLDESNGEYSVAREAFFRGLFSLELQDGELQYNRALTLDEDQAWVKAHEQTLKTILKKREKVAGRGSMYGWTDNELAQMFCTYVGEGQNTSVAVSYDGKGYRMYHGVGKIQASSRPEDMRIERMLGDIAALLKPDPKDVLVVACGAGVTAGSFVPYGSDITIVDIEPLVPKYVTPQFWKENHDVIPPEISGRPTGYKHTRVIVDDGRHYVRTTPRKFDIVTTDLVDPWVKGCAALNTVEYLQMCKAHLKPGGVVAFWLPLYECSEDSAKSVIATFSQVFPNAIVWSNDADTGGYDTVLFAKLGEDGGTDTPTKIDLDAVQAYVDSHPAVKSSLRDVGFGQEEIAGQPVPGNCEAVGLLATYAGSAPRLKYWTGDSERLINRDSNLRLQYIAGLGVNYMIQKKITAGILKYYHFPTELFSGSPERMAALKALLEAAGRRDGG